MPDENDSFYNAPFTPFIIPLVWTEEFPKNKGWYWFKYKVSEYKNEPIIKFLIPQAGNLKYFISGQLHPEFFRLKDKGQYLFSDKPIQLPMD